MLFPEEFIKKIPKTDLHLHLDGSIRLSTLIELAKHNRVALPSYTEDGLRRKVFKTKYRYLIDYLQGFYYVNGILRGAENLERAAYELARDNIDEGVRYIEVRFAPQLHAGALNLEQTFRAVCKGLEKAKKEFNKNIPSEDIPFHFGVIAIAHRNLDKAMSPYVRDLLNVFANTGVKQVSAWSSLEVVKTAAKLVKEEGLPITGFDIAGQEAAYPAQNYKEAFRLAHENSIKNTVHAGEADGPESIFHAVADCRADRIGHGTFLFAADMIKDKNIKNKKKFIDNLSSRIAQKSIGLEVCLTSNLQTIPKIKSVSAHPAGKMIKRGLPVTICTDNRLISGTTVTGELKLLADNFNLSAEDFKKIVMNGFKQSFFPGTSAEKQKFLTSASRRYDRLSAEKL